MPEIGQTVSHYRIVETERFPDVPWPQFVRLAELDACTAISFAEFYALAANGKKGRSLSRAKLVRCATTPSPRYRAAG